MIEDSTLGFNVIGCRLIRKVGRSATRWNWIDAAVAMFRRVAAATRRQGRNDRLFLEALHHHLDAAIWKALLKRFERLSNGLAMFERSIGRRSIDRIDADVVRHVRRPSFRSAIY